MSGSEKEQAGRDVLVVDDNSDVRRMLQFHLEDRGWNVALASDGAEALETILVERPDLVVLDVMMPELNGWEVLRYMRSKSSLKETPVIMLTGIGAELNDMTSPLYGASAHLDKPVRLEELDQKMAELLGDEPVPGE